MNRVNQVELSAGYCEGRGRQTGCVSDGRHLRDAGAAPFLLPFSLFRRDATSTTITSFNRFCRSSSDGSARNERCVSTEFRDFRKVEESFYPKLSPPLPLLSPLQSWRRNVICAFVSSPPPILSHLARSFLGEVGFIRPSSRGSREIARFLSILANEDRWCAFSRRVPARMGRNRHRRDGSQSSS